MRIFAALIGFVVLAGCAPDGSFHIETEAEWQAMHQNRLAAKFDMSTAHQLKGPSDEEITRKCAEFLAEQNHGSVVRLHVAIDQVANYMQTCRDTIGPIMVLADKRGVVEIRTRGKLEHLDLPKDPNPLQTASSQQ